MPPIVCSYHCLEIQHPKRKTRRVVKTGTCPREVDRVVAPAQEPHIWAISNAWSAQSHLAEQGNSSWKPKRPLRLVHAAKNDTATMVLQEEELCEFSRNMSLSTGKGPSDAICKARWRVEQLNIAKDFVEIFDDIEAVVLEAEEVNEPTSHQPK